MIKKRIIFFKNSENDELKSVEQNNVSFEESDMRKEGNTSFEETSINAIENVEELEISQNIVNNVRYEETVPTRTLHNNISDKVIRFINGYNIPKIIGLFGIDYDDRIGEIKAEVESSEIINHRYCILSFIVENNYESADFYDYLAASMFNYLNKYRGWYPNERYEQLEWINCLQKVKKRTVNDWDELESLVIMAENDNRPEAMKELIHIFLRHMRIEKIVFIIDLHNGALSSTILKMLRQIENNQCMFILGSMLDRDMQYDSLGEGDINRGRNIYYKYFGFTN